MNRERKGFSSIDPKVVCGISQIRLCCVGHISLRFVYLVRFGRTTLRAWLFTLLLLVALLLVANDGCLPEVGVI